MFCGGEIDWSATAAWAQAVLSALAIFVSTYVAARVANLPGLTARHQRLGALLAIVRNHQQMLQEASKAADDHDNEEPRPLSFDISRLDRALKALEGLPLIEYSAEVVDKLIYLETRIMHVREEMDGLRTAHELREGQPLTLDQSLVMHSRTLQIRGVAESTQDLVDILEGERALSAYAEKHWLRPFDPAPLWDVLHIRWLRLTHRLRIWVVRYWRKR